ncbi:5-amino-6-(5-phospho-D-ribitylamino)uracil phosphatase YigB [Limnobaculum zhutongyuii]|uniref:5-amino-6-(5-phospho-D-ribitylamino)uracil phosphatase YigB n=1 Tax=Limnobaculum zhutongyuii TaxID=2498113 RepID=A0A411WGG2_9GAMM|nr:5-amino-6-(5-phospho-D-ribitylamino)uracil phosphatase YigB [Limnobaculum zhutongyuii]QBH95124.1 5-amino-6-(5-phospho-D-ribitylamino)uracil phosphatase YigB [Limnobaculum zhutongyuii]TQS86612.1 5-amino-6-(5-phospho-D-ribitylamino)uracil phosphatase YigB [Limnobaculum zhutongyuii]
MHFYRPLGPVKALTFDLDDTLYDNRPVIERTEREVVSFMQQQFPQVANLSREGFNRIRHQLLEQEPDIYHDVSEWRRRAFETTLQVHGYSDNDARQGAELTMEHFSYWRSRIDVPQSTHTTLSLLATHYPLVAVTNGNANPHMFGLSDYFKLVLRAGPDGRAKPFGDMYLNAAQQLKLAPETILHVGDDLITDVAGAIRHGLQACWINDRERNIMHEPTGCLLPHIEISRLESLCRLI